MAKSPRKTTAAAAKKASAANSPPLLEWIAAGLGLLMTVGVIGFLLWEASRGDDAPPQLIATAAPAVRTQTGYYVKVTLRNEGRVTASQVEVEAALQQGETVVEATLITFDFLPEGSERTGGLYFQQNPSAYRLALSVKGQIDP